MTERVPEQVAALVTRWVSSGRPTQPGPPNWRRTAWIDAFPQHAAVFDRLPDDLTRDAVQAAVVPALDRGDSLEAFLPTMAWGYGTVGYGPYRVANMLASRPDVAGSLLQAGRLAAAGRALDGYRALAGAHRVAGLGPAFGTKYLYFVSPLESPALILDQLVAAALARTAGLQVRPGSWSARTYRTYLDTLTGWARQLDVRPDDVELVLFVDQASRDGSQWGQATGPEVEAQGVCCWMMQADLERTCELHPDRASCPDALVRADPDGSYGLRIHDGGGSAITIAFCPWCGSRLAGVKPTPTFGA